MQTDEAVQYGVRYPDGTLDWVAAAAAWGDLWDPRTQADFQRNYAARLAALGVVAGQVEFVQRTVTTTYGEPEEATPPPSEGDADASASDPEAAPVGADGAADTAPGAAAD